MFADDSVIVSRGFTPSKASDKLNKDLKLVTSYFNRLQLLLNLRKTKIMNFDLDKFGDIISGDIVMGTVDSFKYLGLYIDNKLTFTQLANFRFKQVNHKLFLLRKIRGNMDAKTSLQIYKSMALN